MAASLAVLHQSNPLSPFCRYLVRPGTPIIKNLIQSHGTPLHKEATEEPWLQPIPQLFEGSLVSFKEPHL